MKIVLIGPGIMPIPPTGWGAVEILVWDTKVALEKLGHDEPQHKINWMWLAGRARNLWIHCKDLATLHEFSTNSGGYNYFWHDKDDYTLTSKGHIWSYPGKTYTGNTVVVMPEWNKMDWDALRATNCHGVCTDYALRLSE